MTLLGPRPPRFPTGISDFSELRSRGYSYIDKTSFVAGIIDSSAKSLLFPRPRRFGKILNMSTLRYFLERTDEDRSELFSDTAVWAAKKGLYQKHFQKYPVI